MEEIIAANKLRENAHCMRLEMVAMIRKEYKKIKIKKSDTTSEVLLNVNKPRHSKHKPK